MREAGCSSHGGSLCRPGDWRVLSYFRIKSCRCFKSTRKRITFPKKTWYVTSLVVTIVLQNKPPGSSESHLKFILETPRPYGLYIRVLSPNADFLHFYISLFLTVHPYLYFSIVLLYIFLVSYFKSFMERNGA